MPQNNYLRREVTTTTTSHYHPTTPPPPLLPPPPSSSNTTTDESSITTTTTITTTLCSPSLLSYVSATTEVHGVAGAGSGKGSSLACFLSPSTTISPCGYLLLQHKTLLTSLITKYSPGTTTTTITASLHFVYSCH